LPGRFGSYPLPAFQLGCELVPAHAGHGTAAAEQTEIVNPEFRSLLEDQIDLLTLGQGLANSDPDPVIPGCGRLPGRFDPDGNPFPGHLVDYPLMFFARLIHQGHAVTGAEPQYPHHVIEEIAIKGCIAVADIPGRYHEAPPAHAAVSSLP
jgi:hypothetical protein